MTHRSSLFTALGVVVGLSAGAASVQAWTNANRLTYLTFSGPVELSTTINAETAEGRTQGRQFPLGAGR